MSCTVATPAFPLRVYSCHAAILLPSSCSCCHVAVHHTLICSYSSPQFECGYSWYHPASPCHHVAILAAMQLFLPPCGYFCCHAAINCCHVAILAAVQLFLPPCGYFCCHAAIPATMWLFLLPCSYSCHNGVILAAMQLILPPCGYSCCPAAVIPAICVVSLASIPSDYTI